MGRELFILFLELIENKRYSNLFRGKTWIKNNFLKFKLTAKKPRNSDLRMEEAALFLAWSEFLKIFLKIEFPEKLGLETKISVAHTMEN